MDRLKRSTLDLIESASSRLSVAERGRQLIKVVADYVLDDDLRGALEVLKRMDEAYFYEEHLYRQAAEDHQVAEAAVVLIEAFGLGFAYLVRPSAFA